MSIFRTSILAILCLFASLEAATQKRDLKGFSGVETFGKSNLVLTQGDTESVTLEADDSIINDISTSVENGNLHVRYKNADDETFWESFLAFIKLGASREYTVKVTTKQFKELNSTGSGTIKATNKLTGDNLTMRVTGAADVNLDIEYKKIEIDVFGAGSVTLKGTAESQDIEIQGAGTYKGNDLITKNAIIKLGGAGSAAINASDTLDVTIQGAGDVTYKGTPKVSQKVQGAGSVKPKA